MASHELRLWTRSFSQADGSNDDNVFRNVSLITIGEAKGHNCQIDETTLQQLLACSERFRNGVRANLGHFTGVENSFGHITNIRVDGDKLLGDLNLFTEHPNYKLTKKQIQTIPDTMGFSVYFNGPDEVKMIPDADGKEVPVNFARCTELYSSDLVPEPAANPSGVFEKGKPESITVDKSKKSMAEKTDESPDIKSIMKECMGDMLKEHSDHMEKMSTRMDEITKKIEEIGKNDTTIKDKDSGLEDNKEKDKDESPDAMESRITEKLLKAFTDQKKSPPASATSSVSGDDKSPAKKDEPTFKIFHEAYRAQRALGKNKSESLTLARKENFELYKAYCVAQENGESWTREPLDAKDPKRLQQMIETGKLI